MATVASVDVVLRLLTSGFQRTARTASQSLAAIQKQAVGVASSFRFIGGAAAIGGIVKAIATISEFEAGVSELRAVLSGSVKDTKLLSLSVGAIATEARRVAVETQFTAVQVLKAAGVFTRAGLSARLTAESLESVAQFAAAAGTDIEKAADIAVQVIKGFDLNAEGLQVAVDQLVTAALTANTTIEELGEALKIVSGISRQTNQEISTVTAILGIFANAGLKATLGGTALRGVLVKLVEDSSKINGVLRSYGISLFELDEATGAPTRNIRQLTEILGDLGSKVSNVGDLIRLFRQRALAGALAATRLTSTELAALALNIRNGVGAASRVATERLNNLKGELIRVRSAVEEVFISLGVQGGLIGQLRSIAIATKDFFLGLSRLSPAVLTTFSTIAVNAAKVGALAVALIAAAGATSFLLSPLGLLSASLLGIKTALDGLSDDFREVFGLLANIAETFVIQVQESLKAAFLDLGSFLSKAIGEAFEGTLADTVLGLSSALKNLSLALSDEASISKLLALEAGAVRTQLVGMLKASDALVPSFRGLADSSKAARIEASLFAEDLKPITEELIKISSEIETFSTIENAATRANQAFQNLLSQDSSKPGFLEAVQDAAAQTIEIEKLQRQLESLKRVGTPEKILGSAREQVQGIADELRALEIGSFDAETERLVASLRSLRDELVLQGADTSGLDALIDKTKELRAELKSAMMDSIELGRGFSSGIEQIVTGFLRGTREIGDASTILKQLVLAEFESLFRQTIQQKLMFDSMFKGNLLELGKFAKDIAGKIGGFLQSIFMVGGPAGGGGGSSQASGFLSGLAKAAGSLFSGGAPAAFAQGGIVPRGVSGVGFFEGIQDEAVIPLRDLRQLVGAGGGVVINNNGALAPNQIGVREINTAMGRLTEINLSTNERSIRSGQGRSAIQETFRVSPRVER